MDRRDANEPQQAKHTRDKRPYRRPEVVDYGNVRDVTQFAAGSVMDATVGLRSGA